MAGTRRSTMFVATTLAAACNPIFGIREGEPRPICVATSDALEPMIDDMEDGDGFICESNARHGHWYTFSDGTSTDLTPPGDFDPTLIPGGRGTSRYAAHLAGSGFTKWGAGMGLNLNLQDLSRQPYDATTVDGIKFWMKSTSPVFIAFPTPQTDVPSIGGQCEDTPTQQNCGNPFAFVITAPGPGWVEYEVPFMAIGQLGGGTLTWNPRNLVGLEFSAPPGSPFDVWVDDLRFYRCPASGCMPTCTDPAFPVPCRAVADARATCVPTASDCAVGCNASNTVPAPVDALITAFDGAGGADITDVYAEVPLGPAESAPTFTTNGALHIQVNAPVTSTSQVLLVDFAFKKCVDATKFTGVQFSIGGSVSGCTLGLAPQDSAHLQYDGVSSGPTRHGTGASGAHPPATALTADQLTAAPQTVMIPFGGLTGGVPPTPIDKSKLTWLDWVFFVDPSIAGGPATCIADVVVDDVRFY